MRQPSVTEDSKRSKNKGSSVALWQHGCTHGRRKHLPEGPVPLQQLWFSWVRRASIALTPQEEVFVREQIFSWFGTLSRHWFYYWTEWRRPTGRTQFTLFHLQCITQKQKKFTEKCTTGIFNALNYSFNLTDNKIYLELDHFSIAQIWNQSLELLLPTVPCAVLRG